MYYEHLWAALRADAQRQQDAIDKRRENILVALESASFAITAITDMSQRSMNKELEAAGDNKDRRLAIEKDYFQKQKKWAISQIAINTAVAATRALNGPPVWKWIEFGLIIASGIAQTAVVASQSFAKGAIVSGPMVANIGEYPGARHNPEVVAPLDKLQAIIGDTSQNWPTQIEFKIKRRALIASIKMDKTLTETY